MSATPSEYSPTHWNLVAAVATWVCPGLGHIMLGHLKRGLILAITLGLLWTGGLLIGGIGVIDRQSQPFWFVGQMLIGPSLAVQAGHTHLVKTHGLPRPGANPAYTPSLGRVHEQGTLYTALAGLLNLMTILDVLYRPKAERMADGGRRMADGAGRSPRAGQPNPPTQAPATPPKLEHPHLPPSAFRPPPSAIALLAYRPLLDPLPFDGYWYYVPLVIAIAVVYKTIKLDDLRRLPRDAAILAMQITVFMVLIAAAVWLLVEVT